MNDRRHMNSFLSHHLGTLMALLGISWWGGKLVPPTGAEVLGQKSLPKAPVNSVRMELVTLGLRWRERNKWSDGGLRP